MRPKDKVLKAFPKAHCLIAAFKPHQRYIVWAGRAAPDIMLGMGGTPA